MRRKLNTSCRLSVVCLALVLVVALSNFTDGRYLPTRADESELTALKELIANIFDEAEQHERDLERERERHQLLARSSRFYSTYSNRAKQFGRQHYSMKTRASDEDQLNRMLLNSAFLERRSAELVPPTSLIDLDGSDLNPTASHAGKLPATNQNPQQLRESNTAGR